jgi:hypothetical protein
MFRIVANTLLETALVLKLGLNTLLPFNIFKICKCKNPNLLVRSTHSMLVDIMHHIFLPFGHAGLKYMKI